MKSAKKKNSLPTEVLIRNHFANNNLSVDCDSIHLESFLTDHEDKTLTKRKIDLALTLTRLEPYDDILDLCCRHGKHTIELCSRSYRGVVGVDLSRLTTQVAKKNLLQSGFKGGKFSQGDPCALKYAEERFDGALLLSHALGGFDKEEDDLKALSELFRVLRPHGVALIELLDAEWIKRQIQHKSQGYIDENLLFCRERYLSDDEERLITREVILDPKKGRIAEEFYAEKLYAFEKVKELLEKAGFCDILKHHYIRKNVKKQDLAAQELENRLFITAKKPSKHYLQLKGQKTPLPCHVLLADRHYERILAKNRYILKEDPLPVTRLKEALQTLSDFQFTFFENHEQLIKELMKNRPSFVFNLCTQGLFNDDEKELHIPALLDALRIPYSGSPPHCLALCYDRAFVTSLARTGRLLVSDEIWVDYKPSAIPVPKEFPAVVKPAYNLSGESAPLSILVKTVEELNHAIDRLNDLFPRMPLILQERLPGPEYSVGVFGNRASGLKAFPVIEVIHEANFADVPESVSRDYERLAENSYDEAITCFPARLSKEAQKALVHHAFALFQRLGARDVARFDFRKDQRGNIKLIGAQPNPSLFEHERFAHMAAFTGIAYPHMLEQILAVSLERNKARILT